MSNNCSGKKCAKPKIDDTPLAQRRNGYQRLATSLRTGTAKVFREVRELLCPLSSRTLRRWLVTTTVTTTLTTKVITIRARSTTTIETTTTTASTTKVASADSVKTNPTLHTSTVVRTVVRSDPTEKITKTTRTSTTTTTTTTTNMDPIGETTTTVRESKTREYLPHRLYRNRRHSMYYGH